VAFTFGPNCSGGSLLSPSLALLIAGASVLPAQPAGVRLALVTVPDDVLRPLLPAFEQQHKLRASRTLS
jgi:hypothetical protein